jgi:hypothetical protein
VCFVGFAGGISDRFCRGVDSPVNVVEDAALVLEGAVHLLGGVEELLQSPADFAGGAEGGDLITVG